MFHEMEKALRENKYSYLIDDPIERAKNGLLKKKKEVSFEMKY
jgi:hypothetical protein